MASITIKVASGTTGKFYANASSTYQTASTAPSSNITVSCEGATSATISLHETSDGGHIANCPMIYIQWNNSVGGRQSVLFGSSTANKPLAQWKVGSSTISYSPTTVSDGSTITVTAVAASGTADTTAPSDIGIAGYYYAHNGRGGRYNYSNGTYTYEEYTTADTQQGIRSKPARCGNRVPVDISFKYNGTAKYFIYIMMRGWTGSSAGVPGDMGMLSGQGPIVNSTFLTRWGAGYDTYRMDVFALSASGIYPSLANMDGDGPNVSACASNATWIKWPADPNLSTYSVKYYATNGTTLLRSNTEAKLDLDFEKATGSAITFYKETEIYKYLSGDSGTLVIPSGKRFKGWQKKEGSGSYGSVITTSSGMGKVGSSDVSLKLVVEDDTVNIVFKPNYPSGSSGSGTDVTKSWVIGTSQSLPAAPATPTKTGYTITFAGWYDADGNAVPNPYTVPSSGKTFYAHWNQSINSYTLTTQVASASSGMGTVTGSGTKQYNSSCTITATPITGYDFTKWIFTGGKAGESTSASTTFNMPAGDVTATAYFGVHNYVITYNLGSSDVVNPNPSTYTIEDENILLADPIRPGYVFLGWSPQGYIEAGSHGDMTFTANWFKEMDDFTPDPGRGADDNGNFGIDASQIDDNQYYQFILELPGDRANYPYEYTAGIDYSQYGISVEENKWSYDSGVITGKRLKELLAEDSDPDNHDYIFPMDIWRCRINHSRGELTVTLNLYDSTGQEIIGSTSKTKEFALKTDNKPHITKVELHEGVVNIKNLDLGANNQESTKRFVGNKKSSVLATVFASNLDSEGKELLYEAVPCQFIVRLDGINTGRSDAQWDTGDIERILTQEQIAEFVGSYNGGEMEYPCEDLLVTEEPFPSINSDLPNARLRIKIWDSRRE